MVVGTHYYYSMCCESKIHRRCGKEIYNNKKKKTTRCITFIISVDIYTAIKKPGFDPSVWNIIVFLGHGRTDGDVTYFIGFFSLLSRAAAHGDILRKKFAFDYNTATADRSEWRTESAG